MAETHRLYSRPRADHSLFPFVPPSHPYAIMKALAIALAVLAAGSVPAFAQTTLANWNFDSSTISGSSTNFGPITADFGVGAASGHHAAGATTWSTPVGNGSAKSFSSNTWAAGDYYQFQTSSTGQNGLMVSWDQFGSSTGPKDFQLQVSTDGLSFTNFASYAVLGTPAWSSGGSRNSAFTYSYDLSSLTNLDNQASVYFRLIDLTTGSIGGGTVATTGTGRVDNFSITAIPEPSTYAVMIALAGFAFVICRRKTGGQLSQTA